MTFEVIETNRTNQRVPEPIKEIIRPFLKSKKARPVRKRKPVIGVHIYSGAIVEYAAIADTARDGFTPSCIVKACKGIIKRHRYYRWSFKE